MDARRVLDYPEPPRLPVSMHRLLCFLLALSLWGCDPTAPTDLAEATSVGPQTEAFKTEPANTDAWLVVTEYTVPKSGILDAYYEPVGGVEVAHSVVFMDAHKRDVAGFRYTPGPGRVQVEGFWPLVKSKQALLTLYHNDQEVFETTVYLNQFSTQDKPLLVDEDEGWIDLGESSFGGRSVHRKPGEVRVDSDIDPLPPFPTLSLDDSGEDRTAPREWCVPPKSRRIMVCDEHGLTFFEAAVPNIKYVQIRSASADWFVPRGPTSSD